MVRRRLQALSAGDALSPAPLIFRGSPPSPGGPAWADARVEVLEERRVGVGSPRRLLHLAHHSESLSWGYAGSGPADLALSIVHLALVRAFSVEGPSAHPSAVASIDGMTLTDGHARAAQATAAHLHQDYKFAVVAGLPIAAEWTLEERSVQGWILEHLPAGA